MKYRFYENCVKRILDFVIAACFILLFWWVYLAIALLVRINLGSPVFFTQERPGMDEKIFKLYKFRTMTDERDEKGNFLSDEVRLTKFGRFLRSTSLDELPEFFNILKGEMSLIGPRPLLVRYLPYYTENERKRHNVRPGLTGLAQVNGRNNLDWNSRLQLDIEYVENITFKNDLEIIFKTIKKVLYRSDVVSGNQMIMEDLDVERKDIVS